MYQQKDGSGIAALIRDNGKNIYKLVNFKIISV
jgi:hypothetical protein